MLKQSKRDLFQLRLIIKKPDPLCDLDIVPNTGRNQDVNVAMSNSLGFGGHNATIIFKKYGE